MNRSRIGTVAALLALLGAGRPAAAASPDELMKYIPAPVNTVAVVNVGSILSSPRATREGWAKKDHVEYLAGAVPVHPSVERILLAKELALDAPGRGGVLAVLPLLKPLDLAKFAASRGGKLDQVNDEPVAVTANGTVGVKLADKILGMARTDSRQEVARWVRYAKGATTSQQSKFLNAAVFNAGTRNHILIAVDTEDLFHPQQAGLAVARSQSLEGNKAAADAVEAYLVKLKGIRFTANITADGIAAEVRLESGAPATLDPNAVKAFLLEVLDRNGAALEDARTAAAKADGNAVTFTFKISDPELARVMAIVSPPMQGVTADDVVAVAPAGVNAEATRKYYKTVNTVLDDLKAQNKKAKDYNKTAVWHDTAANRIDTLSALGVDPEVVGYGVGTANRLRAIADSLRGVPIQSAANAAEGYMFGYMPRTTAWMPGRGFHYNPWMNSGPSSIQTNLPEIMKKEAAIIKQDEENRGKLWDQIEQARSAVRQAVARKSAIDLDANPKK